jgi:plastocyanin
MRAKKLSLAAGTIIVLLISGVLTSLPLVNAQSTVKVSMPNGAGLPANPPGYAPDKITVVIGVNNTVMWANNDTAHHTVTPSVTPSSGSWPAAGSGDMAPAATYSYTFTTPGNYTYICTYHNWMIGYVLVKAAASTSTTTSTTPEFPTAALGALVFVVLAALILLAPRLRNSGPQKPGLVRAQLTSEMATDKTGNGIGSELSGMAALRP